MSEELMPNYPTPTADASATAAEFESIYQQAEQARDENDLPRAYGLYARATELNPNHAGAWAGRAATTVDLDESIADWAYALALAPNDSDARAALNACIAGKIVRSDATQAPSLIALGRMLARAGQKAEAQRMFQGATELDNSNVEAWIWRAGVTDDAEQMVAYLKEALKRDPDNAQAKAGLKWASSLSVPLVSPAQIEQKETARLMDEGRRALASNDKVRAHDLFKQVTERDPKNEDAWLWRGSTTTDVDEALASIEQALAINPHNPSAREAQSWLHAKRVRVQAKKHPGESTPSKVSARPGQIFRLLVPALILVVLLALIAAYAMTRR